MQNKFTELLSKKRPTYPVGSESYEFIRMIVDNHRYGRYAFVQFGDDLVLSEEDGGKLQSPRESSSTCAYFDHIHIDGQKSSSLHFVYAWYAYLLKGGCSLLYQDNKGRVASTNPAIRELALGAYAGDRDCYVWDSYYSVHSSLKPFFRCYGANAISIVWKDEKLFYHFRSLTSKQFLKLIRKQCDIYWNTVYAIVDAKREEDVNND